MSAPKQETMDRDIAVQPARPHSTYCCGLVKVRATTPNFHQERPERVFYDSAKAERTCLGKCHYCIACPGWSKATDKRVVYSRWDMVTLDKLPSACVACFCDCGQKDKDWLPPPDPKEFKSVSRRGRDAKKEEDQCCSCLCPCGRTLDTFDADIVIDASAHQTICQICRDEGDVVLYRKAGADLSDQSEVFVMADVVKPFDVFNELTFELSKINLKGATTAALGQRMGATVWDFDARSGVDGSSSSGFRGETETIYYDSNTARRTCFGYCCNMPCCCPPIYKITSERVMYTSWDWYRPCDNPFECLKCGLCWATRGCARECCCAIGASAAAAERRQAMKALKEKKGAEEKPGCCSWCCAIPVGRTANYFDIDIVADIRAHQSCWQLCLNEGSLHLARMQGGDASHDGREAAFFNVKFVPEVFAYFDSLSYDMAKMNLTSFRQNAMRNDIFRSDNLGA